MIAVCRKELRSYRISMIGYVFVAFMLAVVSLYFAYQNLNLASPRFELVLQNVQFMFLLSDCHSNSDHEVYCGR